MAKQIPSIHGRNQSNESSNMGGLATSMVRSILVHVGQPQGIVNMPNEVTMGNTSFRRIQPGEAQPLPPFSPFDGPPHDPNETPNEVDPNKPTRKMMSW